MMLGHRRRGLEMASWFSYILSNDRPGCRCIDHANPLECAMLMVDVVLVSRVFVLCMTLVAAAITLATAELKLFGQD